MARVVTIERGATLLGIGVRAMESRVRRRPDAVVRNSRGRSRRTTFDLDVLEMPRGKKAIGDAAVKAFALNLADVLPELIRDATLNVTGEHITLRDKAIAHATLVALREMLREVNSA